MQNEVELYELQKDPETKNEELVPDEEEMFLNQYSYSEKLKRPLQNF